jgi:hypothetical protein
LQLAARGYAGTSNQHGNSRVPAGDFRISPIDNLLFNLGHTQMTLLRCVVGAFCECVMLRAKNLKESFLHVDSQHFIIRLMQPLVLYVESLLLFPWYTPQGNATRDLTAEKHTVHKHFC